MKKLLVLCITGMLLLGAGGAEALAEEGETSATEAAQAAPENAEDVVNSALEAWHSNALRGYTWAYVSADGQEKETCRSIIVQIIPGMMRSQGALPIANQCTCLTMVFGRTECSQI